MTLSASSSVQQARRDLADRLGEIRREAGITGRELAQLCGWHPSKTSRIENARTVPSPADLLAWCRVSGADDQASDLIASLRAVEGMFVEWRRIERDGLKRVQESVLPRYERTRRFRAYSSWLVTGLLQTRAYTDAVLRAVQRRRVVVDDVDAAVEVRMERQRILREGDRRFAVLLEESVLRSGPGSRDVQREQLAHLLTVGALPHVSLGIVAMGPGRSRMPVEGFWIYDTVQVNVELVSGYLTITQPSEIALYAQAFAELADQAVHGEQARALIGAAMEALA
ncbi:helix-turn-helix transcriptional regulator [Kitasatospora sp. NBC_01246]|uniref:helix-turn-helix domain-containing protein n=1 Tax=Kitasatospora sp. NBC_01246 TaxID=2903570 RepID=UPI002E354470|nr:helix-turn-helix transcriptional regulator [Kitasatospora sp. NBC_01246]